MSFGDREDELWEAMKPSFKPRLVSDPNIKYAKHLVNQTGPFATRGALTSLGRTDVRATLARVVRRAPEVLVKVRGGRRVRSTLPRISIISAVMATFLLRRATGNSSRRRRMRSGSRMSGPIPSTGGKGRPFQPSRWCFRCRQARTLKL